MKTLDQAARDYDAGAEASARFKRTAEQPTPPKEPTATTDLMPPFPDELIELPHGLGAIQDWIVGRMIYPSRATAGITALATMTAFAQSHVTVKSFAGLGLNEQYMVLAPTGFGKEDLRKPIAILKERINPIHNVSWLQWAAPSSLQGLHGLIEEHPSQFFMSDEFAEWLAQTGHDHHKQAALGYLMQVYTKALGTVNAPAAIGRNYGPVDRPRVSVLATSTAERVLESMTLSHADSGAYNRWLIFVAEQEQLTKRYTGHTFEPPSDVIELVSTTAALGETEMTFTQDGWQHFVERDSTVIEPLKFNDNHLAGRLSEQAIKIAALVALADYRHAISGDDMRVGYAIREGLYYRARALADHDGAISGMHATGQALEQVRDAIAREGQVYKSRLPSMSRKYKALSVAERNAVLNALYDQDEIADSEESQKVIVWQGE